MYVIDSLMPSGGMGGYGFSIQLMPQFKEAVAIAAVTQEGVARVLQTFSPQWLAKTGFGEYFDPDNCGYGADKMAIPGPRTKLLHDRQIRVEWGEWGPEHISVPGNACGLDISRDGFGCLFKGGATLTPHNVDHWGQVNLLLLVFTWFAHHVALSWRVAQKG